MRYDEDIMTSNVLHLQYLFVLYFKNTSLLIVALFSISLEVSEVSSRMNNLWFNDESLVFYACDLLRRVCVTTVVRRATADRGVGTTSVTTTASTRAAAQ